MSLDAGTYSPWHDWGAPEGTSIASAPAITASLLTKTQRFGELHVVVLGGDGNAYHGYSSDGSSAPSLWENLGNPGAPLAGDPGLTSEGWHDGAFHLELVALDDAGV